MKGLSPQQKKRLALYRKWEKAKDEYSQARIKFVAPLVEALERVEADLEKQYGEPLHKAYEAWFKG